MFLDFFRGDFYHIAKEKDSPVGLPEGLAENLVKHSFYKWKPKVAPKEAEVLCEQDIPVASEVVVSTEEVAQDLNNVGINEPPDKQRHLQTEPCFTESDSYNGNVFENYCWSQTIADIDISIKVAQNMKAKDITVSVLTSHISVEVNNILILRGDLCHNVKHKEAIWSLDKRKLQIHLDKCQQIWWDCLLITEEKIDLTNIDCSRPFEDLSDEAQAKIEELEWNQRQKELGLPTSDDLAKQELLRKAWNVEGSPFSGPFDPTTVAFH
ncbi:uncharacterized protein LOC132699115 isoform X2 [Cylas formicarius]|uniref:uncharacterized protein LOC132699115 isoform X2 n=1 Tax=Cylas formicarius TaxID=197179 RepID=UPI0029587212|nr:uncharacterized protein LOC132699115 isoform X2 [Cylas formicarius]